jgi:hypothetical protein
LVTLTARRCGAVSSVNASPPFGELHRSIHHGTRSGLVERMTAMPNRKPPESAASTGNFRARYDELEQRRIQLLRRLAALGGTPHPGHGRARTLLNTTFRKATLVQRAAILQAADWVIALIERSTLLL